jgi:hypothetical protein
MHARVAHRSRSRVIQSLVTRSRLAQSLVPISCPESCVKMTIITPCCRPHKLPSVYAAMAHAFDFVEEWIIVYDGTKVEVNPNQFADNAKISEYVFSGPGMSGNPQRNFALDQVRDWDTWVYFLDDDNVIHPRLFELVRDVCSKAHVYSFNQLRKEAPGGVGRGNRYELKYIDTAQVLVWGQLMSDMRWDLHSYGADGMFIEALHARHGDKFVFVDKVLAYYNRLR